MERHEGDIGQHQNEESLYAKYNEIDSDDDELFVGNQRNSEQDPDSLVGKQLPEFKKSSFAPATDIYDNNGPTAGYFKENGQGNDMNVNSDSCSAVSSNSDDGRSSKSGGDSSDDKNNFSSCSEDSDGTKKKLASKAKAFKENVKEESKKSSASKDSLGERVSKKYKRFVMRANKVLTTGKNQMVCWNFSSRD